MIGGVFPSERDRWSLMLFASIILGLALVGQSVSATSKPKVILIVADYLTLSDLTDHAPPGIARLVAEGGIGLVSPGPAGSKTTESAYASAGAGGYCWSGSGVDQAYTSSEAVEGELDTAGVIYKRRTGQSDLPAVVHLGFPQIVAENKKRMALSLPGALADTLAKAGKTVAIFGNADVSEKLFRRAAAIAATSAGAIPIGDVSARLLRREPFSPTGYVTDIGKLASDINLALGSADLVVVHFGDTARVELNKMLLSEQIYKEHRRRAMNRLDELISIILKNDTKETTIMLVSMAAPYASPGGHRRLAPIAIRYPDSQMGALISPTTRTAGLVSQFDIAPTVLSALNLDKPRAMTGAPISVLLNKQDSPVLLDERVVLNRIMLWPVLGILAGLGIASITLAAGAIALGKGSKGRLGCLLRTMLIATSSTLLAMLLATAGSPVPAAYVIRLVLWMVFLTIIAFMAGRLFMHTLREKGKLLPGAAPFIAISVITSIVIFIDTCLDGKLGRFSVPGAGDFAGYRFYGIGNEYAGVLLGMSLVSIVWLRECFPGWEAKRTGRSVLLLVSAAIVGVLGFPRLGADAGGAIAAVVGLGLIYLSGVRKRFSLLDALLLTAAGIMLVIAIGFLDMIFSKGSYSHLGLAASMSEETGHTYLFATAYRKLMMNFRLIGTSQSVTAIFGSLPFAALWFLGIRGRANEMVADKPMLRWGILAILPAIAAAFLFNDSGVISGGLILGFLVIGILYSILDREKD